MTSRPSSRPKLRRRAILAILALVCPAILIGAAPARAAPSIGVVLLHGKTGMPNQLAKLSAALTAAGYAVETPEMCWSKRRILDKALPDCLGEVDAAVDALKAKGVTAIVVGGTSQGAVAAFAYGAAHATLAGIVGMAPAADAVDPSKYPDFAKSLETARTLVAAGKGDTATDLTDIVSGGKDVDIKATPKAFLTFHGPDSPIATIRSLMATTLPKLKMPVLWVAGTRDDSQGIAPRAFAAVPRNGLNRYVTVDANHAQTPDVAAPAVLAWLKTLQ